MPKLKSTKTRLMIRDYESSDVFPVIAMVVSFGFDPASVEVKLIKHRIRGTLATTIMRFNRSGYRMKLKLSVGKNEYRFVLYQKEKHRSKRHISIVPMCVELFHVLTGDEFKNAKSKSNQIAKKKEVQGKKI
jgi:hypothetical protein